MIRAALVWLVLCITPAFAQDFSGLARVLPIGSAVTDTRGGLSVALHLSQPVPYRVFTLDAPRRLVLDFREADFAGVTPDILDHADGATALRFGRFQPGWSRMVVDLAAPVALATAEMTTTATDGSARLTITLKDTDAATFAATAGAPPSLSWGQTATLQPSLPMPTPDDGLLTVIIDPGHGGVDPGAIQGGVQEADLMLRLGREVAEGLNRAGGIRAVLTRDEDMFVSLEKRMTIGRAVGADLLISLHADALEEDDARGASVYTLNATGADRAAARMAERHERGDMLAGVDLTGQADGVATVLMDLARAETAPAGDRFADALVAGLRAAGVRLHPRPRREGRLAVLNAPDFASVLVEVGFLSNAQDRDLLKTPEGRAPFVAGIVAAVLAWAQDEAARAPLLRQ